MGYKKIEICTNRQQFLHNEGEFEYMDTFERIRSFLAEQLGIEDPETITMDSDILNDLDADSLDVVDMIMTLEDEFEIVVPDEAIEDLHTVGDVVRYVEAHKAE